MTTHVQQTLPFPWQGGHQCSLQLLIQPWICAPGTHYGSVGRGSVEYEVCLTLLHMASSGNRTPDHLILSPMPYPLGSANKLTSRISVKKSDIFTITSAIINITFHAAFICVAAHAATSTLMQLLLHAHIHLYTGGD